MILGRKLLTFNAEQLPETAIPGSTITCPEIDEEAGFFCQYSSLQENLREDRRLYIASGSKDSEDLRPLSCKNKMLHCEKYKNVNQGLGITEANML